MSKTLEEHNYHGIDATIIADSKNEHGQRITSFVCTFPRIVLAEFNTHRMLSRNSASSRAVPFEKMLKDIKEHPFIPIKWMKDHKGMQGNEYLDEAGSILAKADWLAARTKAADTATLLHDKGVTKQFVNRLLEPFKWHTVIVTATEWENFFVLRADEPAEIHIQDLAFKMLEEYNNSEPKQLKAGEWHIPFGDQFDIDRLEKVAEKEFGKEVEKSIHFGIRENTTVAELMVKIATARCARVSYENFEGGDDYQKDINLHDRLASMGHWSPFEHCARAMDAEEIDSHIRGQLDVENAYNESEVGHVVEYTATTTKNIHGWSGNFQGFIQYRKMFNNENKTDERVK